MCDARAATRALPEDRTDLELESSANVRPGDKDWRDYYRNGGLNLPHQYHNGGIWPFIGGFHVAALARAGRETQAAAHLELLAASVYEGRSAWEFNEWLHGVTGRPMGKPLQAWSAAMFLFAREAVVNDPVGRLEKLLPSIGTVEVSPARG